MQNRWRGRSVGLVILLLLPLSLTAARADRRSEPTLSVVGPSGSTIATVPLATGTFTLRYRNSLYRSWAEEHYAITADGAIRLLGLRTEELAVLEEYYEIDGPARRSGGAWHAQPLREHELDGLTVAATDLGRRTLIVDGVAPLPLWRLVDDADPMVRLAVSAP